MAEKRTSVFENGLIWFGAAVSIAEILTGTGITFKPESIVSSIAELFIIY